MKFRNIIIFFLLFNLFSVANAEQNQQFKLQDAFPNLSFNKPVDLQHAGDGTNRIFVASQSGFIYVFENTSSVNSAKIFLDIQNKVPLAMNWVCWDSPFIPTMKIMDTFISITWHLTPLYLLLRDIR